MFTKSARFYDALYHFKDYERAADEIRAEIERHNPTARTLLDVGCGTGQHAYFLQRYYGVQGLDLNPELLAIARERCPALTFHEADMTDFELGERFDVVGCLFSSIAYVQTVDRLRRTLAMFARHLKPGGLVLVEPWLWPEQYWLNHLVANFVDQPELKIAWMYRQEREGNVSIFNIHYMVCEPKGIEQFTERHAMGLFTDAEYRAAFEEAGLDVSYDPAGFFGRGLYRGVARRAG